MIKGTMSNFDICKKLVDIFVDSGYNPHFFEENTSIDCIANDIYFTAEPCEDDMFACYCEFYFEKELSSEEKGYVTKLFNDEEPVIFENLHFTDYSVLITMVLPTEFYDEDLLDDMVLALHKRGGVIEYLKTNSAVPEEDEYDA